jgi:hypothetical protein
MNKNEEQERFYTEAVVAYFTAVFLCVRKTGKTKMKLKIAGCGTKIKPRTSKNRGVLTTCSPVMCQKGCKLQKHPVKLMFVLRKSLDKWDSLGSTFAVLAVMTNVTT